MEWVETTGRTVEEALDAALDELGVDEDEVEYEVLAEPRAGLFGRFGGAEARVRARVRPVSREKPGGERRRRRGGDEASPRGPRGRAGDRRSAGGADGPRGASVRSGSVAAAGSSDRREPGDGRRRNPRRAMSDASYDDGGATMSDEPGVPIAEQARTAESFTSGLVEAFGAAAAVRSRVDDDDTVVVDVSGEGLGLLVGPRGATLHAIEELVRTAVQRRTGGHGARINVDVGGYRAKRREALEAFTRRLVSRVLETGREQALEPMTAADRKIVHDVAAGIDGVATASEGEEPRRRVVIRRS